MGIKLNYNFKGLSIKDAYAKVESVTNELKKDGVHQVVKAGIYVNKNDKSPLDVKEIAHVVSNEMLVAAEATVKDSLMKEAYKKLKETLPGEDLLDAGQTLAADLIKSKISKKSIWAMILTTLANIGAMVLKSYMGW